MVTKKKKTFVQRFWKIWFDECLYFYLMVIDLGAVVTFYQNLLSRSDANAWVFQISDTWYWRNSDTQGLILQWKSLSFFIKYPPPSPIPPHLLIFEVTQEGYDPFS